MLSSDDSCSARTLRTSVSRSSSLVARISIGRRYSTILGASAIVPGCAGYNRASGTPLSSTMSAS
jgi:hypothetical protein